ncbi:hypothetical protein DPEC_G00288510 [Dallia pectoralis]|uniref:Uncharacterized protein n=1 Tax=Dallia pectoralis TaxID=75939 RepID=A0ACC2FKM2_DALPE|nr:hypothetical protein DPEC_G00288510 [Dallia pectoralis]
MRLSPAVDYRELVFLFVQKRGSGYERPVHRHSSASPCGKRKERALTVATPGARHLSARLRVTLIGAKRVISARVVISVKTCYTDVFICSHAQASRQRHTCLRTYVATCSEVSDAVRV